MSRIGNRRSFKLISINGNANLRNNRFISRLPIGSAKKAFSQWSHRQRYNSLNNIFKIVIRETTQNSKKKLFTYNAIRIKLPQKKQVRLSGGQIITYNYKNIVKKRSIERRDCPSVYDQIMIRKRKSKRVKTYQILGFLQNSQKCQLFCHFQKYLVNNYF